jgi:hypothetical protein
VKAPKIGLYPPLFCYKRFEGRYTSIMKIFSTLLLAFTVHLTYAATPTWQWLDANGRKVFSDRAPPPEIAEKNIIKRPAGSLATSEPSYGVPSLAPAPTENKTDSTTNVKSAVGVDKELEAKKKKLLEAEQAKRKAAEEKFAKAKAENCSRAKEAKATYDSGVRISKTAANGEKEVLDDAARSAEIKRLMGIIESDCK